MIALLCVLGGSATLVACSTPRARTSSGDTHIGAGGVHIIERTPGDCQVCNVYEMRRDSVVRILTTNGLGTGVVIDERGTMTTTNDNDQ
jgi:hypothetical protein